jgi:hypothetical protein
MLFFGVAFNAPHHPHHGGEAHVLRQHTEELLRVFPFLIPFPLSSKKTMLTIEKNKKV